MLRVVTYVGFLSGPFNGIILNFIGSFQGVYTGGTPIMEYPTFYLFDTARTGTNGAINWCQYPRMGAQQNQLCLYLQCVIDTMLRSFSDNLHRAESKIKA